MLEYINTQYKDLLIHNPLQTVSVHFRLGHGKEASIKDFKKALHAQAHWYTHVMTTEFHPSTTQFILVTDNIRKLQGMIEQEYAADWARLTYKIIDEDYATTLAMMSMCQHHIGSAASISFWGAYLDKNQPRGKTFFPPEYRRQHDMWKFPFDEWREIPVPS